MRNIKRKHLIFGILGAVLLFVLYYSFNPENSFFPKCIFKQVTGWDCAGCGSQRMLHALLHGDFAKAWSYNAGIIVISPIILTMILASFWRNKFPRFYHVMNSPIMIYLTLALCVAWGVLRNVW